MRGVRGGLKDQVRAFREFLLRRKKKRVKEAEKLKLKEKKRLEEKKQKEDNENTVYFILNDIENKIFNCDKIDFIDVSMKLDNMKKEKANFHVLDRIEEVKEKVEVEIIFEEIIKPKSKSLVIASNLDNDIENKKIEKFITLSSKFVNNTNDVVQINHYFDMVSKLNKKHIKEQSVVSNNKLNQYVVLESKIMEVASKKTQKNNNFDDKIEKSNEKKDEVINVSTVDNLKKNKKDEVTVTNLEENKKVEVSNQPDEVIIIEDEKKHEVDEIIEYVDSEKFFDSKDFEAINNSIKEQIIYNENEIRKIQRSIPNINDIFKEQSGFDKFLDFSTNLINLGRGVIGKHIFSNNLNRRLNSEILINNSLKGIHRVFSNDKQEVPYIVFESFMHEINDKKDCAIKIKDICEDSLEEIRKLKADFIIKYGNVEDVRVNEFLNKFDSIENDLLKRQEEAKKIELQAINQYKKNYQKVKVKKNK